MQAQADFHRSDAKYRAYIGGFGSGKSLALCMEALSTMIEHPGTTGVICRYDYTELLNTTWKTLTEICPREIISELKQSPPTLKLTNKSVALGYNLKRHEQLQSLNLGWGAIDEVNEDGVTEDSFKQLIGRCRDRRGPGKIWLGGNPGGKNWVYQRFFAHTMDPGAKQWPNHAGFRATTDENTHLPAWYLEALLQNYDDAWLARFKAGDFDVFEGQILDTFNTQIHCIEPFPIPLEWPRFRSLDHGLTNPTACLWGASDFDGNLYIYREFYKRSAIIEDNVRAILEMSKGEEYDWTVIDPSTRQRQQSGGQSERIIEQYRKAGLNLQEGDNDFKAAVTAIRGRLAPRDGHIYPRWHLQQGESAAPTLYITDNCRSTIWEAQNWRWKNATPGSVVRERELERDNHAMAALRYLILRAPRTPVVARTISFEERFAQLAAELAGEKWFPEAGLLDPRDLIGAGT